MQQTGTDVRKIFWARKSILFSGFIILAATTVWAVDDPMHGPGSSKNGLRGILSTEVPEDLSAEAFAVLDGNWKEWSEDVAGTVAELYENKNLDVAGQREVIAKLKSRLKVMETSLADIRYRSIFDPLYTLHGRIARRVDIATATLDTLDNTSESEKVARLESARRALNKAVENLSVYLRPMANGSRWLTYVRAKQVSAAIVQTVSSQPSIPVLLGVQRKFKEMDGALDDTQRRFLSQSPFASLERSLDTYLTLAQEKTKSTDRSTLRESLARLIGALEDYERDNSSAAAIMARKAYGQICDLAPDGGQRITDAMRTHYFNYNLKVVASEAFLSRMMAKVRTEEGPVRDYVLGADIYGEQTTKATVGIDLKPSDVGARFHVTLDGVTESDTQGVTEQATIYTSGYHSFLATKEVSFDGDKFKTHPATISVNPSNTTTGARTKVSGIPIFGSFFDSYAVSEARRRRGQSEAIAVDRVSRKVIPKFNKAVDEEFGDANVQLDERVNAPLRELNLYPSEKHFRTSETKLWISTRLMETDELSGDRPNTTLTSTKGIVIHLHESLLNNSLDRMELAGRTVTEDELKRKLETLLTKTVGRDVKFQANESKDADDDDSDDKQPTTLVFPASDPIRIHIEDGSLSLIIRTGLKQEEGKDDIPTQKITVPLEFSVEGDDIVIKRGTVSVSPVERPKNRFVQIARAGVVRKKIQSALPERKLDRFISVERDGLESVDVAIAQIKTLGGWVSVVIE